ncbi:hypothetical protein BH11PLA1_BH11PLA1_05850 [soil metagenome]
MLCRRSSPADRRSLILTLALTAGITFGVGLGVALLGGCSEGSRGLFGILGSDDPAAKLSLAVRQAAESYLSNIGKLTDTVKGITGYQTAIASRDQVSDLTTKVRDDVNLLTSISGPERDLLAVAFGARIEAENQNFLSQANRFSNDTLLTNAVGYLLKEVRLFDAPKVIEDPTKMKK